MSELGVSSLPRELLDARAHGTPVPVPPSAREGGLSLDAAYAVEAELRRMRRDTGRRTVGRKVGFANRAMWRVLKLQTLVWASMYDDTVRDAPGGHASLSTAGMHSPRLEPEVVFKLKTVPASAEAPAVLDAVEWLALGFEVVDCPFPDWKFQPVDFVACFGFHAALVVGEPRPVERGDVGALAERLAALTVRLRRNGELVEEGYGKNALRSPALCLGELASAIAGCFDAEPLAPGELISTGTLTAAQPIAAGERWSVEADGLDLPGLTLDLT